MMLRALAILALVFGLAANAAASVPRTYAVMAAQKGIPAKLFFAQMLQESGRPYGDRHLPWPWTLNIAGEGRYFDTREEAHAALVRELARGNTNVDVGLGQINWRWNGHRFPDTWTALDPIVNLRVATEIFHEVWVSSGDLWEAVGLYHNRASRERQLNYRKRVLAWLKRLG